MEERCSDSARVYCDPEATRCLLEGRDEKELRDLGFFFGTFRKDKERRDLGDLRTQMDEGQKWVQEHSAPWAKSFLETRQRSRWKEMTDVTNQAAHNSPALDLTCKRGSIGQSEGLLIPRSSVRFRLNPDNSNSDGFELHGPSNKGTKLLLKVIKAIIIIRLFRLILPLNKQSRDV